MAVAVTVREFWDDGKRVHVLGTLTFSGNYATNGDAVTLTGLFPGQRSAAEIVGIQSTSGYVYTFDRVNSKILVFQAPATGSNPLSQISASAYPAGVTGDTVSFYAVAKKFV